MLVTKEAGARECVCRCGNWLKHWEKGAGHRAKFCASIRCFTEADFGAYVHSRDGYDRGDYVVPLCADCFGLEGDLEVISTYVPAGVQPFCGHREGSIL